MNGYRRLCDYNGYNNCDRPIIDLQNYACSPNLGCHATNSPANEAKGVYSDYQSCKRNCQKHVGKLGFQCSPNLGCHKVNEAPNQMKGIFTTWGECMRHCEKPLGNHSYSCMDGKCRLMNAPPNKGQGRYESEQACQLKCGTRPQTIDTYDCHPAKGGCVKIEDGSGHYATLSECKNFCKLHN